MSLPPSCPTVSCPPEQDLIPDPATPAVDNSGRPKLKDVGAWLKCELPG